MDDVEALIISNLGGEAPGDVDGNDDRYPLGPRELHILLAEARRDMHHTGAVLDADEIGRRRRERLPARSP